MRILTNSIQKQMEENNIMNSTNNSNTNKNQSQIAGAILVAGILITGAILLKGNTIPTSNTATNDSLASITLSKVDVNDMTLGNPKAKVALILYEDFQCPFCGAISGLASDTPAIQALKQRDPSWTPFMAGIKENYIKNGKVQFVYRDWAFLGPESIKTAEAARCAGDQNKFWEYHDYLYGHQNGENEGAFSDPNLKSFAKKLSLDTSSFDKCLDSGKYTQAVNDSRTEGSNAGVNGTPKGFILKNGKIVATIEGAESYTTVKQKIDSALK
ncbi:DsbA family protein [Candidatus Nomurabacteria bacterium]|nr:DsbA family protein [Candidatus Nomurabacteria bacterium]